MLNWQWLCGNPTFFLEHMPEKDVWQHWSHTALVVSGDSLGATLGKGLKASISEFLQLHNQDPNCS